MAAGLKAMFLGLLLTAAQPAHARPLDPQRQEQLTRYQVVLQSEASGDGGQRHRAMGLFAFPAEEVFRVATSYERYSEYMPRIVASHIVSQSPDQALVSLEAALPWPMSNIWVYARFQNDPFLDESDRQAYRIRFVMLRGNLQRYEGSLLIEPFGEGQTLVTYELLAEPETRVPRAWVQRAVGRGVVNFVHYLRSRVSQTHRPVKPTAMLER